MEESSKYLFDLIVDYRKRNCPGMRLGQFLMNKFNDPEMPDVFYEEDDEVSYNKVFEWINN